MSEGEDNVADGWKTVRTEARPDTGETITMKYAEFGKGRAKSRQWKIFCGDVQVNYAVSEGDADENFDRALKGDFRYPTASTPAAEHWTR